MQCERFGALKNSCHAPTGVQGENELNVKGSSCREIGRADFLKI